MQMNGCHYSTLREPKYTQDLKLAAEGLAQARIALTAQPSSKATFHLEIRRKSRWNSAWLHDPVSFASNDLLVALVSSFAGLNFACLRRRLPFCFFFFVFVDPKDIACLSLRAVLKVALEQLLVALCSLGPRRAWGSDPPKAFALSTSAKATLPSILSRMFLRGCTEDMLTMARKTKRMTTITTTIAPLSISPLCVDFKNIQLDPDMKQVACKRITLHHDLSLFFHGLPETISHSSLVIHCNALSGIESL
jgi:hypothetical protein